jgi:two-component system response regulator AtoC
MPQMDGMSVLREVRQIDEEIPIVIPTAFGTVETTVEAMTLSAEPPPFSVVGRSATMQAASRRN